MDTDTPETRRQNPVLTEAMEFLKSEAAIAEKLGEALGYVNEEDEARSKDRVAKLKRVASLLELLQAPVPFPGQFITCETLERAHIESVIDRNPHLSLDQVARILGIDIATLYRKRKRWGLVPDRPAHES
jgi:DNA-binding NtrC family response regulator